MPKASLLAAMALLCGLLPVAYAQPVHAQLQPDHPAAPAAIHTVYLPLTFRDGVFGAVAPVRMTPGRGIFDHPFALTLATATPGAFIRYTLDGSLPTAVHGELYTGPVGVGGTTIVRAAAFAAGYAASPVETATFIFTADVLRQSNTGAGERGFPATWGLIPDGRWAGDDVPADYFMRPEIVERYGAELPDALRALPSISIVMDHDDLFDPTQGIYSNPVLRGDAWERPVSVEWFGGNGLPDQQIDAGIRIAGGYSRRPEATAKHSLSLRFRARYGASRLSHPLFPDSPVREFKTLRLRAGQADHFNFAAHKAQYIHDQWGRDTQRDMGWPTAHGAFAHVYVEGLYWGIYNASEEPTAAFAASHLGGDDDDWDVIRDGDLVDGRWSVEVEDGNADAFEQMLDVMRQAPDPDPMDRDRYARMAAWLDVPQFIDYHLIQIHAANWDWPNKNWRAARNRELGGGFRFFMWDMEHTTALRDDPDDGLCTSPRDPRTGSCGYRADTTGVQDLHGWLKRFPEYRLAFADRVQRHFFTPPVASFDARFAGALTPGAAAARYAELARTLEPAVVAESARWGAATPMILNQLTFPWVWERYWRRWPHEPQTPDHWRLERDRLLGRYFPARTGLVLQQLCDQGLYPLVAPPELAVTGDPLTPQYMTLALTVAGCEGAVPGSIVLYTLDGSDPRVTWSGDPAVPWSGKPSLLASEYHGPVKLPGYAHVQARAAVLIDGAWRWSALVEARFGHPRLAVSEVMYHPAAGGAEFIELQNVEPATVDISGLRLSGAVRYTAPEGAALAPGARLVLTGDAAAFRARYPDVTPDGEYDGQLDDDGETIVVTDADGRRLAEVVYRSDGLWPRSPDGWGWSLVPNRVGVVDSGDPEAWRASTLAGGSPGAADPDSTLPRVVVNEVLANSTDPLEDAIEIRNLDTDVADVGGWFLSDDARAPQKFRIPAGTMLPPGGYRVFYEGDFGVGAKRFALGASGESAVLSSADARGALTGYMRGVDFPASADGVSLGRHATSEGVDFTALAARTFGLDDPSAVEDFRRGQGAPNAPPLVGPVVINELMIDPAPGGYEFVELVNRTDAPVALFDETHADRRWRFTDGITFTLPAGLILPPGGYAVIAGADPERFRQAHAVPDDVPVLGPITGKLSNDGEAVDLARPAPDDGDADIAIPVDHVRYRPGPPWPAAGVGQGRSLERRAPDAYGNEPRNWSALRRGGTPGRANTRLATVWLPVCWGDGE